MLISMGPATPSLPSTADVEITDPGLSAISSVPVILIVPLAPEARVLLKAYSV